MTGLFKWIQSVINRAPTSILAGLAVLAIAFEWFLIHGGAR
jgi:hypothetical protein